MFNTWDFLFLLFFLLAAYVGWRLKALPLLGLGFAFAVAPEVALRYNSWLGNFIVERLGGRGLEPHQDQIAWWLLVTAAGLALFFLALTLSKLMKDLQLEFLDQGAGAFIIVLAVFLSLGLNGTVLAANLRGASYHSLTQSWSWQHLQVAKEPPWLQSATTSLENLKLPQKL